jgi:MFS superfamily sulfate permease-like transporter
VRHGRCRGKPAGERQQRLSVAITFLAGVFCIVASFFRLGALADFLSKPILVGFLNGIAITICLGQIGKLLGLSLESKNIISQLLEIFAKLPHTQVPTLLVGTASLAILFGLARWVPRLPAAPIILIVAATTVVLFGLDRHGIAILGPVPPGLPPLRFPRFPEDDIPSVVGSAAGLALVLFSSGMLSACGFASKGGYEIDADREFAAFGAANLASAISQGFGVTGADSRTAVSVAAGGPDPGNRIGRCSDDRGRVTVLDWPPAVRAHRCLGALLVFVSISLFDTRTLREIWRIDRTEVGLAAITALGAINGIRRRVGPGSLREVDREAQRRSPRNGRRAARSAFYRTTCGC